MPADVVDGSTDYGTRERAPQSGVRYVAFADAAGGTGSDCFACAIAHVEGKDTVLLDAARLYQPRFVPSAVIAELTVLLRSYGLTRIFGDKYAIGFHADEWKRCGIVYTAADKSTTESYLAALPLLLAGRVRLIDNKILREQLMSLERRAHASGRETVSHPQVASAHDDLACAVCGSLVQAAQQQRRQLITYMTTGDVTGPFVRVDRDEPRSRLVRGADGSLRIVSDNTCTTSEQRSKHVLGLY